VCAQVTQTKTGLSAVRTFSPLGVNTWIGMMLYTLEGGYRCTPSVSKQVTKLHYF
jgi:hypothetical protein